MRVGGVGELKGEPSGEDVDVEPILGDVIPTEHSTESSGVMAKSLPCGCELAPGLRPGRLRRLFGLVR